MKEHEDDLLPSVQSTVTVDSTTADETVTEKMSGGEVKLEGFLGERDEGEDMMVDVVGADAIADDHGRTGDNLDSKVGSNGLFEEGSAKETGTRDLDMEEVVGSGEDASNSPVGSRVLNFEKVEVIVSEEGATRSVEVSKAAVQSNVATTVVSGLDGDAQKSGNGSEVGDSKMDFESSSREPQVGEQIAVNGSVELTERGLIKEVVEKPMESVQGVADGDCVMDQKTGKEAEVLDSSKIEESSIATANLGPREVDMVVVEEVLAGKDEAGNSGFVNPSLVLPNNQTSLTEVANAGTGEGVVHVSTEDLDHMSKEESLHPTIEVLTDNAQTSGHETGVGDSKMDLDSLSGDPRFVGGEKAVVDREEESERGLTEEVVERSMECNQEVADGDGVVNEETGNEDEALDSSKISESSTAANPGLEDIDVVVVEEGLASKEEAQDSVSVGPSLVCPTDQSLSIEGAVNVNAENLNQQSEIDKLSKEESLHPTIEVTTNDAQKSKNGTGGEDSKMADELSRGETTVIDREEKERGLTEDKEIVERPAESVQNRAVGDGVVDEKTEKEDEVLDSSMVPESLTTANLGSEEVDVMVVEEGLTRENEAPDSDSVDAQLVSPDNRSLSTEAVHANTENLYRQAEVDPTSKDESLHPTIEVISIDASHGSLHSTSEQQVVNVKPATNSTETQTIGGDLVSFLDTTKPFAGGGMEQIKHEVSSQSTLEAFSEHHQTVVAECEVLTIDNKICDSGRNIDNVKVEGSKFQVVEESSKTEVAAACTEADEVASRTEVHEVTTTASKVPNSEVQDPSAGGMDGLVENQRIKVNALTESSKPEPESSVDQNVPATADKGAEIDSGGENCKVEFTVTVDMSISAEDPVLKVEALSRSSNDQFLFDSGNEVEAGQIGFPNSTVEVPGIGETNGLHVSAEDFEEVNHVTTCADVAEHCVEPEDSEFSYEEAHVERGEDAGMDIDEVLGWKDEMPGIDANSEAELEQGLPNSSCEPGLIGQREEDLKFRQPIVYERRVHVEVPLYDAPDGHGSPQLEDEKLQVETDSEEDDRSVQEEQKVAGPSTNLSQVDEMVNEEQRTECSSEVEQITGINNVTEPLENGASVSLHQSCYFQPPENEGQFSVSDLVWGKIRSHPWWPGQICDPSDASEKAMKYHKKDCFLVAYFGDGTFAWNDSSVLKPFWAKFSQIEKNGTSESFKNAVRCALEEVSRRVELGLACTCVPDDIYKKIECQVVENGGIRRESKKRYGIDDSADVSSFEPDKLVDYVRLLARFPRDERDKMELTMAKAQLSSYGYYKGYRQLPEFQLCGDLLEDALVPREEVEQVNKDGGKVSNRSDVRSERPNKKRSLSKRMDDHGAEGGNITSNSVSSSGSKKRKALASISDGSEKRPNLKPEKVPTALTPTPTPTPTPKPSFKVGECIQRVASQLTGPPSVLKCSSDRKVEHADQVVGFAVQSPENSEGSVAEMLSQLCLTALDSMKEYSFLSTIIPFFYSHRSAVFIKSIRQNSSTEKPVSAMKRKASNENDPEEFEFDDVNDSYWTDRIIQNHSEEQLLQDNQNGGVEQGVEHRLVAFEPDKPVKPSRRSNKKRFLSSNNEIESKEQSELMERRKQNLATEVVLKFTEGIYFPSEIQVNKMFRHFGPLMESETEVDRQGGRARVVFKKCSDAEVAHSSAGKFNIFGSIDVNYELNYTPLISYKPLPLPILQDPMDAS